MERKPEIFVLMPFRPEFDDVYMVIRDACQDVGVPVNCRRADEITRPGQITDQVIEGIIAADVIIADLTGSNPNVMYELGFAQALGKPSIILNQSVADSPFDVRGLRQIVYDRARLVGDCRPRLITTVKSVLGAGGDSSLPEEAIREVLPESELVEEDTSVLRPSEDLVLEIDSLYLAMKVARAKSDVGQLTETARSVIALVDRLSVEGVRTDALEAVVASVGNCALQLEIAGFPQEAEDLYKRVIGLDPEYAGNHLLYADFLVDQGRIAEAVTELQRGRELDPTDRRASRTETKIALATGVATPELGEQLRREFEESPGNKGRAAAYLAYLDKQGSPAEFAAACAQWREALPDSEKHDADRALADYYSDCPGHESQAMEMYAILLEGDMEDSDRAAVLHNMALTMCETDPLTAEEHWRLAYALRPDDKRIRMSFARRLLEWKKTELAERVIAGETI